MSGPKSEYEETQKPAAQHVDRNHALSAPPKSSGAAYARPTFGPELERNAAPTTTEASSAGGAFEDAKNYFPSSQLAAPKRKDTPQSLGLKSTMQFNGVVGRASIYMPTKLTNPNTKPVSLSLSVSGADFEVESISGEVRARQKNDNVTDVFVRYMPTRPGTSRGLLRIEATFEGESGPATEQHIELYGTATSLENLTSAPADGSPRAIPDLSSEPSAVSPREQAKHDLDAASGLADTYTAVVGHGDVAASNLLRQIGDTTHAFDRQLGQWVEAELAANKESERSPAWKALGLALGKGLEFATEKLELGSVVTMAAGWVADKAIDGIIELANTDHETSGKKAAGSVANEGGKELVAATNADVGYRVGQLATNLAVKRAVARQLAGQAAIERQQYAQRSLSTEEAYEHKSTAALMNNFRDALDDYNDALRAIAGTATQLGPKLVKSFDDLRMNYLKARAHKSSDLTYRVDYHATLDMGSEENHGRETLNVFQTEVSGYSNISEDMRAFIRGRRLSEFVADADISVHLDCKQDGGLVIEKKVGKEPRFTHLVGNAAIKAAIRSPQGVWTFLQENIG